MSERNNTSCRACQAGTASTGLTPALVISPLLSRRHSPTTTAARSTTASSTLPKGSGPVGLQIVAPMWEDGTAIEFAALLSETIGGFTAPPAFAPAIGA